MLINFELNGKNVDAEVDGEMRLLDLLRGPFNLTGAKEGCGQGECGACTVIVDNKAVNSCIVLAYQVDKCKVLTIEGLSKNGEPDKIQEAFVSEGAIQCGYCTPGMIMSAKALLLENPHPSKEEIVDNLAGNICRCTGYAKIIKAVQKASGQE